MRTAVIDAMALSIAVCACSYDENVGFEPSDAAVDASSLPPDAVAPSPDAGPAPWLFHLGGDGHDRSTAVVFDETGNVIVAGCFTGTAMLGDRVLEGNGVEDIFVAKYDETGGLVWVRTFGGVGFDCASALAVDGSGDVAVAGAISGAVAFGAHDLVAAGNRDGFVVELAADTGEPVWAARYGGVDDDVATALVYRPDDVFIVAGQFAAEADFGGESIASAGQSDVYLLACRASDGGLDWVQTYGGEGPESFNGLAIDLWTWDLIAVGEWTGRGNFGFGEEYSAGSASGIVARYSGSGLPQTFAFFVEANAATVDNGGAVFGVGTGGPFAGEPPDIWVRQYTPAMELLWDEARGGVGDDRGTAVAVDELGNFAVAGAFSDTVDFGGSSLQSAGWTDGFVALYRTSGDLWWVYGFGGSRVDEAAALALRGPSEFAVAGAFEGEASFLGVGATSRGGSDAYMLWVKP